MTDPVILAIIVCAILAMSYALLPQITGNAEWLKDRRSELAAAIVSACLMAVAFTLKQPEPEPAERVVTVEKIVPGPAVEPTPEYSAKVYEAVQSRYVKRYRESVNGSLSAANPSVE